MARRVLNVAEKPSVAKEVSNVLSGGRCSTEQGASRYNRIHRFEYQLHGVGRCQMEFTSVLGHLMELEFADPTLQSWGAVDPAVLFTAAVEKRVKGDQMDVQQNLQNLARHCDILVLWLDCDREGENIAMEVVESCRQVNPRIEARRARFSTLTQRDLQHACANLVPPSLLDSYAVDARSEIDLRSGAAFTRLQTKRLQNKYEGLDSLVSYGPCQFPTLGFIVDRYLEVQAFLPEPFWTLRCEVTNERQEKATFSWTRGGETDCHSFKLDFAVCARFRL
eukprot:SAG31_NODE_302_length_18087_cov_97.056982_16_plen_279_part_00